MNFCRFRPPSSWGVLATAMGRQNVLAGTGPQQEAEVEERDWVGVSQALGGLVNMKLERKRRQEGCQAP